MSTSRYLILSIASLLVLPYAVVPLQMLSAPSQGFTISVTDGRSTVSPGGSLIYAITVSLYGNDVETADVALTLPDYTTLINPSNGGQLKSGKVVWTNLTMNPNTSITMTVQTTLLPSVSNGTILSATATVDGISSTDKTTVGTSVIPSDTFKVSLTDKLKTVSPTQEVTYTATVKNVSSKDVTTDVHMTVSQFVNITDTDPGAETDLGSATWHDVTLEAGSSETFTVEGKIARFTPEFFLITAKVQAGGVNATDLTSVQTNIDDLMGNDDDDQGDAKIRFSVSPDSSEVLPGGRIRYTVTVRNTGSDSVDDLTATVKFDPSVALLLSAGNGEKTNASTLKWNVPKLSGGQTWRTSFELALIDGLPLGTTIPVISTLQGSSIDSITLQSRVAVTSVALIGNLPATGAAMDTIAALLMMPMAMGAAALQRRLKLA